MKLALLSDLHANERALLACLEHAKTQGADQWAILGDLVGYGPEPEAVVAHCQRLAADGATVLRGNHEALAITPPAKPERQGEFTARWTHERLTLSQRQWLAQLPLTTQLGSVLLVHASVNDPEQWRYVEDEGSAARSLQAATLAIAQEQAPAGEGPHHSLPVVTVSASGAPESPTGPVHGFVAKQAVTATKTDTPVMETPQSITVITRDRMELQGAQSVALAAG